MEKVFFFFGFGRYCEIVLSGNCFACVSPYNLINIEAANLRGENSFAVWVKLVFLLLCVRLRHLKLSLNKGM